MPVSLFVVVVDTDKDVDDESEVDVDSLLDEVDVDCVVVGIFLATPDVFTKKKTRPMQSKTNSIMLTTELFFMVIIIIVQ